MKLNLNKIDIDKLDEELPSIQKIKTKPDVDKLEPTNKTKDKRNKPKRGKD